jgi:hypothetical protein
VYCKEFLVTYHRKRFRQFNLLWSKQRPYSSALKICRDLAKLVVITDINLWATCRE